MKLLSLPKPLLFLFIGAFGALLGWGVGEFFAAGAPPPRTVPLVEEVSPGVYRRNADPARSSAAPSLLFDSAVQSRLVAAGASMKGDIMAALSWETKDDLDLHCIDPSGTRIYFKRRKSRTGGELDVDRNVDPPFVEDPVEHIYWPIGDAPDGKYLFLVYFATRNSDIKDVAFKLDVQIGDVIVKKAGVVSEPARTVEDGIAVFTFDYQREPPAVRKQGIGGFMLGVASVGLTLGFLALGTSSMLSIAQVRMLGSDSWVPRDFGKIILLSLCGGIIAGFVGQALLTAMAGQLDAAGAKFFKVVAWVVVGGMLGFAFSLIIPNLDRGKAILGGLVGGILAGAFITLIAGGTGRFLACLILGGAVGLSVAVVEALAREGCLRVIWGPGEFTTVNLGATPVTVGTGAESTVKIPKSSGFPATIATFTMRDGKAVMFHNMTGVTHPLRNGNKLPLGTVTIEVKLFS